MTFMYSDFIPLSYGNGMWSSVFGMWNYWILFLSVVYKEDIWFSQGGLSDLCVFYTLLFLSICLFLNFLFFQLRNDTSNVYLFFISLTIQGIRDSPQNTGFCFWGCCCFCRLSSSFKSACVPGIFISFMVIVEQPYSQ